MGGSVAAIEEGWMQAQIEESAYRDARRQSSGDSVVVGVNLFVSDESAPVPVLEVDPALEEAQKESLARRRAERDQTSVDEHLARVGEVAASSANLMVPMREALRTGATVGEISDALRAVFGVHRPTG
jgi:methylmalonyl-CoA mutase N-terminal domain/subunit